MESPADRMLTRQIVLNLLLGACAASPSGARWAISPSRSRWAGKCVAVETSIDRALERLPRGWNRSRLV